METDTLIHRQDESKSQSELVELNRKINYWRDKEREVGFKLSKYLNEKADLLNKMQATEESKKAKLLFADCEKIDPDEDFDAYNLDAGDDYIEVHQCKATGWHYLYDPTDEIEPYYCCIGREGGLFKTLEDLQAWARPLYFM